jgi:UDP-N-acetyl-2-amino-2-deoxyglucuronate dehydrogenase
MNKNFVLIGAAGYVAPRHMNAIKETGNNLLAAADPSDSVGILDSYYPKAKFIKDIDKLEHYIKAFRQKIDYISICSPNHLHFEHIKLGTTNGIKVICEKPLVTNLEDLNRLDRLQKYEEAEINTILQLRLHPKIIKLKKEIENSKNHIYSIDLTYITGRGQWYDKSWKGQKEFSGGLAMNIGIHFFDMLTWVFGRMFDCEVHLKENRKIGGFLKLAKANVRWFLSIDFNDLPNPLPSQTTFRSLQIDGRGINFTDGFTDLHTQSYEKILIGDGFGLEDARSSIEVIQRIRNEAITYGRDWEHPLIKEKKNGR